MRTTIRRIAQGYEVTCMEFKPYELRAVVPTKERARKIGQQLAFGDVLANEWYIVKVDELVGIGDVTYRKETEVSHEDFKRIFNYV